jgi:hypothetical protein
MEVELEVSDRVDDGEFFSEGHHLDGTARVPFEMIYAILALYCQQEIDGASQIGAFVGAKAFPKFGE